MFSGHHFDRKPQSESEVSEVQNKNENFIYLGLQSTMLGNSDLSPSQSATWQVSLVISGFRHSGESPESQILVGYVNRDYMTIILKFDQLYGQL